MKIYMVSLFHRATINKPLSLHLVVQSQNVSYRCAVSLTPRLEYMTDARMRLVLARSPERLTG